MNARWIIFRLLLCLALGLVTTVAIAWTSAAISSGSPRNFRALHGTEIPLTTETTLYGFAGWTMERNWLSIAASGSMMSNGRDFASVETSLVREAVARLHEMPDWLPRWGRLPTPAEVQTPPGWASWVQDARGWPMLALWCEWTGSDTGITPLSLSGGLALAPGGGSRGPLLEARALPHRPIWRGLLADTLLFALAWSLLLFASRAIRRRVRIARNLCPACAYNLAGLPPKTPCPECGHAPPPPSEPSP